MSSVGYERSTLFEVQVGSACPVVPNIEMWSSATEPKEVERSSGNSSHVWRKALFSVCTIGSAEITRNPGGDRCICRVIRVLPDVAGTAIFRNDIIIRGGASNEDRFYLDGIEMPAIDHFNT